MALIAKAQDVQNTLAIFTDPYATYKDGYNMGVEFQYQRTYSYNKAHLFHFPNLKGLNYTELTIAHGFNKHFGKYYNDYRLYAEIQVGGILRETGTTIYPKIGFYAGFEWYIPNTNMFIGFNTGADYATDSKVWDSQLDAFWRPKNLYVKAGFKL